MGDHMSNALINSCALCGQCAVICPNGYELPKVCRLAREAMVMTGKMPPSAHEFALLDMKFSMSPEYFYIAPNFAPKSPIEYLFFPGCQLGATMPETLLKTYDDLKKRLGDCGILLSCCGVMARWAGQTELFDETLNQIRNAVESLNNPILITACPTCHETLGEFFNAIGVWDLDYKISGSETYYIHDACGARNTDIHKKIRALGANVLEPKYNKNTSPCCGYGGLQAFANKDAAAATTEFALSQLKEPILTYCANCSDRFERAGKTSRHILELIFGKEPKKPRTLGERRANRKRVRRELGGGVEKIYDYKLIIPEEIQKQMEDRMILDEDIYGVIESARENGEIIFEKSSGLYVARNRIGNATFWAKYALVNNDYVIKSAYSHRMTVENS
jgi:Fe-S oxidoreductase